MRIEFFAALLPLVILWRFVPGMTPPWTMIAIALTLLVMIKLHVLAIFRQQKKRQPSVSDSLIWIFGWAGLNANDFFSSTNVGNANGDDAGQGRAVAKKLTPKTSLTSGLLCLAAGIYCIAFLAPQFADSHPLLAGWIGMIGIVMSIHFGLIHLSAIFWNRRGRPVVPIMNHPLLATGVSEFWGRRWNLAFRDYARLIIFNPLARRLGVVAAMMLVFVFSGWVHDLAISVPAGDGYGWPTVYFLIQAVAVLLERSLEKKGWQLAGTFRGWLWSVLWIAGPAGLLFHSAFVLKVILPIVKTAGRTMQWFGLA